MKKKFISALIATMIVSASLVPAYGAEFTSGAESENIFTDDTEETYPAFSDDDYDDDDYDDNDYDDDDYNDDYDDYDDKIVNLEISKLPDKLQYNFGELINLSNLDLTGLKLKVTYADGNTEETTLASSIEDNDMLVDSEGNEYDVALLDKNSEAIYFDDLILEDEADLIGAGEYFIRLRSWGIDITIPIQVKKQDTLPEISKVNEEKYEAIFSMSGDEKDIYIKFCPEKTGTYMISMGNYNNFNLYDANGKRLSDSNHNSNFSLEAGQEYILRYRYFEDEGSEVTATAELAYEITSIEPAGEFDSDIVFYTPIDFGKNMYSDKDKFYIGEKWSGQIKVNYSNGTSEVISLRNGKNKYGNYTDTYIIYKGKHELPDPGTYDVHIGIKGCDKEFVIKNVTVKNMSQMPTIEGKGTQTVDVSSSGVYARLKTGSDTRYTVSVDMQYNLGQQGISIYKEINGTLNQEKGYVGYVKNNQSVTLAPNTVYYLYINIHSGWIETTNATFTVTPQSLPISKCTVKLNQPVYSYTGKTVTPSVTVKDGNQTLTKNVDYTVTCKNNKNIGTATVTVKGKGSYTGSVQKTFKIQLQTPTLKTVSKSGAADAKLMWNKTAGATGYEVYRTAGNSWKKIATVKTTVYTNKKLKKGTTYKYKIRAYKVVNGKKSYSEYSKEKSIKR